MAWYLEAHDKTVTGGDGRGEGRPSEKSEDVHKPNRGSPACPGSLIGGTTHKEVQRLLTATREEVLLLRSVDFY